MSTRDNYTFCAICQQNTNRGRTIKLSCTHTFHLACFMEYIRFETKEKVSTLTFLALFMHSSIMSHRYRCPLCREYILFDTQEQYPHDGKVINTYTMVDGGETSYKVVFDIRNSFIKYAFDKDINLTVICRECHLYCF